MTQQRDVQAVGQQVEELLGRLDQAGDTGIQETAEELVRTLMQFYGAGLARILELLPEPATEPLLADPVITGLLVLHDLHPVSVQDRVAAALEKVRPYLGSHSGDVELLAVGADAVRLRLAGSCEGCPSSTVTVTYAIEQAIRDAAPEIERVEVEGMEPEPTLLQIQPFRPDPDWVPVTGLEGLAPGAMMATDVAGAVAVICNIGGEYLSYQDSCANCAGPLNSGSLSGTILRCAGCGSEYDAALAGRGITDVRLHLAPIPLLVQDGVVRIATSLPVPS